MTWLRALQEQLELPEIRLGPSQAGGILEGFRAAAEHGVPRPLREPFRAVLATVQARLSQALLQVDLTDQSWQTLRELKAAVDRVVAAQAFARRLEELRTQRGLTPAELARRSGVSLPSLRRLEAGGYAPPRLETLHRLAAALGVTEAELAGTRPARPEPALEQGIEKARLLDRLVVALTDLTLPELLVTDELLEVIYRLRHSHVIVLSAEDGEQVQALQALAERLRQDPASLAALRLRLLRWLIQASEEDLRALQGWVARRQPEAKGPEA